MGRKKPGLTLVLSQPLPTAPLPPPYQLREVPVPLVGSEVCNQRYQNSSNSAGQIVKEDMLCAGSEGRDSCQVRRRRPVLCPLCPPSLWNQDSGSTAVARGGFAKPCLPHRVTPEAPWCVAGNAPGSR